MKKACLVLAVLGISGTFFACNNNKDNNGDTHQPTPFELLKNDPNVNKNAFYTAAAVLCSTGEPSPGCDFKWTGYKISLTTDPNYQKINGWTLLNVPYQDVEIFYNSDIPSGQIAVSVTKQKTYMVAPDGGYYPIESAGALADRLGGWHFIPRSVTGSKSYTYEKLEQYPYFCETGLCYYEQWVKESNVGYYTYAQGALQSPNGIIYDVNGSALNFSSADTADQGRDVIGVVAEEEEASIKGIASALSAKYQLDQDVSMNTARMLADYTKLVNDRGVQLADLADFSVRTYGVRLDQIKTASDKLKRGDLQGAMKDADQMVAQAAVKFRTSPENMRKMLMDFYGSYLQ